MCAMWVRARYVSYMRLSPQLLVNTMIGLCQRVFESVFGVHGSKVRFIEFDEEMLGD